MTVLAISTSPRATWVWAPDEAANALVRELVGHHPAYRGGQRVPLVTDIDIGVTAMEDCKRLAAAGFTFTWHPSQHPLNRQGGWESELPGMPGMPDTPLS